MLIIWPWLQGLSYSSTWDFSTMGKPESCPELPQPALGQSWGWLCPSKGDTNPCTRHCLGTETLGQHWLLSDGHSSPRHKANTVLNLTLPTGITQGIYPNVYYYWQRACYSKSVCKTGSEIQYFASEMQAQTFREDINLPENCVKTHLWQHVQFSNYLLLTLPLFLQFICALGLQGRTSGVMKASW